MYTSWQKTGVLLLECKKKNILGLDVIFDPEYDIKMSRTLHTILLDSLVLIINICMIDYADKSQRAVVWSSVRTTEVPGSSPGSRNRCFVSVFLISSSKSLHSNAGLPLLPSTAVFHPSHNHKPKEFNGKLPPQKAKQPFSCLLTRQSWILRI